LATLAAPVAGASLLAKRLVGCRLGVFPAQRVML
jgi:hypothetical protein